MKAKELQIGDWVNLVDEGRTTPFKITSLSRGEDFEHRQPIPLTAEILEKNGFELITDDTFRNDDGVGVSFENEEKFPAIFTFLGEEDKTYMELIYPNGHIIHVHELQHALRLCGLTELADNLKI